MNQFSLKLRRTRKIFLLCALVCAGQLYGMEERAQLKNLMESVLKRNIPAQQKLDILGAELKKLTIPDQEKVSALFGFAHLLDVQKREQQIAEEKRKEIESEKEKKLLLSLERQKTAQDRKEFFNELGLLPLDVQKKVVKTALITSEDLDEAIAVIEAAAKVLVRYNNLKNFTDVVHILADKFGKSTEAVATKFETSIAQEYLDINDALLYLIKSQDDLNSITELIKKGADINFSNAKNPAQFNGIGKEWRSPLHFAVSTNNSELVKLLLNLDAKVHWADQLMNNEMILYLEYYVEDNTSAKDPEYPELIAKLTIAQQIKECLKTPICLLKIG